MSRVRGSHFPLVLRRHDYGTEATQVPMLHLWQTDSRLRSQYNPGQTEWRVLRQVQRGESITSQIQTGETISGSMKVREFSYRNTALCKDCNGSGKVTQDGGICGTITVKCTTCNGTGRVWIKKEGTVTITPYEG